MKFFIKPKALLVAAVDSIMHMHRAFRCSVKGIQTCLRDEVAFRQECALAVPHFILLFLVPLSWGARLCLTLLWILLLSVELLNTAIEAVVDLASPAQHRLAAKAKDCASAAVFGVVLLYLLGWAYFLIRFFIVFFTATIK